jgi:hypothetical protein
MVLHTSAPSKLSWRDSRLSRPQRLAREIRGDISRE